MYTFCSSWALFLDTFKITIVRVRCEIHILLAWENTDSSRQMYYVLWLLSLTLNEVEFCFIPLQEDCEDFEDMGWYNCLVFFGYRSGQEVDKEDSDIKILPALVEKIILPKLTCTTLSLLLFKYYQINFL